MDFKVNTTSIYVSVFTEFVPTVKPTLRPPTIDAQEDILGCNISVSGSYVQRWLDYKSGEKAYLYLPVIIYILILMLLGIMGNLVVMYIYGMRYKRQPSNYFIITLATFDLLASTIVMPIDVYDLRYHYTFYSSAACKIFRYFESFTTYGSAIVLIQIAFDRYMKICHPLKIETFRKTKFLCVVAMVLAMVLASPATVLFGITYRPVTGKLFCGYDCSIAHKYKGSRFQSIFYGLLVLVFLTAFMLMLFLYIRVWLAIRTRRRTSIGERSSKSDSNQRSSISSGRSIVKQRSRIQSNSTSEDDSVFLHSKGDASVKMTMKNGSIKFSSLTSSLSQVRCSKTTKIFVAVSIAFVVSYLPGVIVMIVRTIYKDIETNSSSVSQVFMKLFSRSHYINNAINPLIYSFLNVNFRVQCLKTFQSMSNRCKLTLRRDERSGSIPSTRRNRFSRSDSHKSEKTKEYEMEHLRAEMNSRYNAKD